jgi:hypothetical protein
MSDPQAIWEEVITAYLDGHISLGRAATWRKPTRYRRLYFEES